MENFDRLLGEVFRTITQEKIKCCISLLDNIICVDLYDADVFENYYTEYIRIGNEESVKRLLDYIKNEDFKSRYIVEYKNDIFNIRQTFDSLQNADSFCSEINKKYNLDIKTEKISERIKRD